MVMVFRLFLSVVRVFLFLIMFLSLWCSVVLFSRLDFRFFRRLCVVSSLESCGIFLVICLGWKFFMLWNLSLMGILLLLFVSVFLVLKFMVGLRLVRMVLKLFLLMLILLCVCMFFLVLLLEKLFSMSSFRGSLIFFWLLLVCMLSLMLMWVVGILV